MGEEGAGQGQVQGGKGQGQVQGVKGQGRVKTSNLSPKKPPGFVTSTRTRQPEPISVENGRDGRAKILDSDSSHEPHSSERRGGANIVVTSRIVR